MSITSILRKYYVPRIKRILLPAQGETDFAFEASSHVKHALTAFAQTSKPMSPSKMKCEDFVAVDAVYQPALVYWAAGVDKWVDATRLLGFPTDAVI